VHYWKAVPTSGILASKIVWKQSKKSERRKENNQRFKEMKQQFKDALKIKGLRQPKFYVRRLYDTLIMGYGIHVGRRLLRVQAVLHRSYEMI